MKDFWITVAATIFALAAVVAVVMLSEWTMRHEVRGLIQIQFRPVPQEKPGGIPVPPGSNL